MYQAVVDVVNMQHDFKISYAIPKEGAILSLDSMVIHKSGKQIKLAHPFIDFMLNGEMLVS